MRDYIITVNSTVDMPKEWLAERGVPVIPLKYTMEGKTYTDMEGLTPKEFFGKLREGKMSVTSQVNPEEAKEMLEPFVKEGKDVLHLSFSSGLSGTANSMRMAAEELSEEYPERKIDQGKNSGKYLRRPDIYCVISGTSGIYVFSDRYSGRDRSRALSYLWMAGSI